MQKNDAHSVAATPQLGGPGGQKETCWHETPSTAVTAPQGAEEAAGGTARPRLLGVGWGRYEPALLGALYELAEVDEEALVVGAA